MRADIVGLLRLAELVPGIARPGNCAAGPAAQSGGCPEIVRTLTTTKSCATYESQVEVSAATSTASSTLRGCSEAKLKLNVAAPRLGVSLPSIPAQMR